MIFMFHAMSLKFEIQPQELLPQFLSVIFSDRKFLEMLRGASDEVSSVKYSIALTMNVFKLHSVRNTFIIMKWRCIDLLKKPFSQIVNMAHEK